MALAESVWAFRKRFLDVGMTVFIFRLPRRMDAAELQASLSALGIRCIDDPRHTEVKATADIVCEDKELEEWVAGLPDFFSFGNGVSVSWNERARAGIAWFVVDPALKPSIDLRRIKEQI